MTPMQHLRVILQRLDCALCDPRVPRDVRDAVAATEGELVRLLNDALNREEFLQGKLKATEAAFRNLDAIDTQLMQRGDEKIIEQSRRIAELEEMCCVLDATMKIQVAAIQEYRRQIDQLQVKLRRKWPLAMANGRSRN